MMISLLTARIDQPRNMPYTVFALFTNMGSVLVYSGRIVYCHLPVTSIGPS